MPIKAFVLIEVGIGKTKDVTTALKKIPGVLELEVVTGPYDVIVKIEGDDVSSVGAILNKGIHAVSGVTKTTTCIAVNLPED